MNRDRWELRQNQLPPIVTRVRKNVPAKGRLFIKERRNNVRKQVNPRATRDRTATTATESERLSGGRKVGVTLMGKMDGQKRSAISEPSFVVF